MNMIVIGDGGHSKVIQDMATAFDTIHILAILDDKYKSRQEDAGIIYGPIASIGEFHKEDRNIVIAIGHNKLRQEMVEKLVNYDVTYISIIHPTAMVSSKAVIEKGSVIMPYAIINSHVSVGSHSIINTNAVIEHDCVIADFVHISPNTTLTGGVHVEEGVHMGASSTVIPLTTIGNWSIIGAGSIVIKDIPERSRAVGNPVRILGKEL